MLRRLFFLDFEGCSVSLLRSPRGPRVFWVCSSCHGNALQSQADLISPKNEDYIEHSTLHIAPLSFQPRLPSLSGWSESFSLANPPVFHANLIEPVCTDLSCFKAEHHDLNVRWSCYCDFTRVKYVEVAPAQLCYSRSLRLRFISLKHRYVPQTSKKRGVIMSAAARFLIIMRSGYFSALEKMPSYLRWIAQKVLYLRRYLQILSKFGLFWSKFA